MNYEDISSPCAKDIVVGTECQVLYKRKLHLAKVKAIGCKSEVEAKEAELVEELTAPSAPRTSQKRPLSDATARTCNQPPNKKARKGKHMCIVTHNLC